MLSFILSLLYMEVDLCSIFHVLSIPFKDISLIEVGLQWR